MLCVLKNHKYVNEVQTVVQVFFPDERFAFIFGGDDSNASTQGYVVESCLSEDSACAFIYKDGKIIGENRRHFRSEDFDKPNAYLNNRRILMLALYDALQEAVGAYTPWGALTGIRPSKLVREWMDLGMSDEVILDILVRTFYCFEDKAKLAVAVAHAEKRLTHRISTSIPSGLAEGCTNSNAISNAIGIYISIPFCPTRCVYCSFNTAHKPAAVEVHQRYVAALIGECLQKAAWAREHSRRISSIYIGGGTPTVLSEGLLEKVLEAVGAAFYSDLENIEYTVEAGRPDTLTPGKLTLMKRYGVNRIAVNPQTLNDRTLAAIGRGHTVADFFSAFHMAREAGFMCINTDLIAGLPGETPEDMRRNMEELAKLSPENITIHTLAVKRASRLNELRRENEAAQLPDVHAVEAMLSIGMEACSRAGLHPYYLYRQKNMVGLFENVGYSLPGQECLYNVGMMAEVQTILGIGAGAVSKFVIGNKITREFNPKNPEIYIERRKA